MKKGKKVTLQEVGEMLGFVVEHMVTKEELREQLNEGLSSLRTELKRDLASKEDLMSLQIQVNSIETHIREMNHMRLEMRVADLEDKVFGKSR